jgi:hypothetical protein
MSRMRQAGLINQVWVRCLLASSPLLNIMAGAQPDTPDARITNGLVHATVQIPDRSPSAYRGTRFDHSGIVTGLQYAGHEFIGKWHEVTDPTIHDAVTGPAEEFLTGDSAWGYEDTRPGDEFPRIGVGGVRKPTGESAYRRYGLYEIVDPGKWDVKAHKDRVEFKQTFKLPSSGYGYVYRKVVGLNPGKPELDVYHSLKNTGSKPIDTSQYSHNFFAMDHQVVGPDVTVRFAFTPMASHDMKYGARVEDHAIVYTRELEDKQAASADITGFGNGIRDYDIQVHNARLGTEVRIQGDRPLERMYFWSIRTVACPEPYVHLSIRPGEETHWTIRYEFAAGTSAKPSAGKYNSP